MFLSITGLEPKFMVKGYFPYFRGISVQLRSLPVLYMYYSDVVEHHGLSFLSRVCFCYIHTASLCPVTLSRVTGFL